MAARSTWPGPVPASHRLVAAAVALTCAGLLGLAAALKPASDGHGTHVQLGMPPCSWAMTFGKPCGTCGMTTAFAHAADGDVFRALAAQPFGAALAMITAMTMWGCGQIALTGARTWAVVVRGLRPRLMWVAGGSFALAWAYKWVTWEAPGLM